MSDTQQSNVMLSQVVTYSIVIYPCDSFTAPFSHRKELVGQSHSRSHSLNAEQQRIPEALQVLSESQTRSMEEGDTNAGMSWGHKVLLTPWYLFTET